MSRPSAVVFAYSLVGHSALSAILALDWDVRRVVTHTDVSGEAIWFPSVSELATRHGVGVFHPDSADDPGILEAVRAARADFLLAAYYRWMLPMTVVDLAPKGGWNLHGSLLPAYRGKAPIHWQVLRGEKTGGVTLHRMVERADAGEIVAQRSFPIGPDDDALAVTRRVAEEGAAMLTEALPALAEGKLPGRPIDLSAGSYFGGRRPEDGRLDFAGSARSAHDLVRAVGHPFPGAFSDELLPGRRVFVWRSRVADDDAVAGAPGTFVSADPLRVACGRGILELVSVEVEGEPEIPGGELRPVAKGTSNG